jgi:hypothetical protein
MQEQQEQQSRSYQQRWSVRLCSGLNESMSRQRRQRDVASPVLPGSYSLLAFLFGLCACVVLDESLDGNGEDPHSSSPIERGRPRRPRRRKKKKKIKKTDGMCCIARHQIYLYEKLSIFFFSTQNIYLVMGLETQCSIQNSLNVIHVVYIYLSLSLSSLGRRKKKKKKKKHCWHMRY